MSRQLRISDDVHEMLSLLKPFPSTSYDEVILLLIEKACPYLPNQLENIHQLDKENPRKAAGERLLLQQELFEDLFVALEEWRREREEARQEEEHIASLTTEEQRREEKEWEELNQRRRELLRERMLREQESDRKKKK
jgi:hypothetical protein